MGRLHVVGYLSIDIIEPPGEGPARLPGGAALYAALGAAASGAEVALHAAAGADFADEWLAFAARAGVDLAGVARRPGPTRQARLRYVDGDRRSDLRAQIWWERTEALAPRPPDALDPADVVALAPMPAALAGEIAASARRAGARVIADTSTAFAARERDAVLQLCAGVDWFAPSVDETRLLVPDRDDDEAALVLAASGCTVLQKRGSAGALLVEGPDRARTRLAPPPAIVVDPTGAGDAVLGALGAALLAGLPAPAAARAALAMGARAVGAAGPFALVATPSRAIRA